MVGVDPTDQTSFIAVNSPYTKMFKGQTTMIRYNLVVTEISKSYDFRFSLSSSSLTNDQFEIQRFFVSNIGDNFPCTSLSNQQIISITNGYIFSIIN